MSSNTLHSSRTIEEPHGSLVFDQQGPMAASNIGTLMSLTGASRTQAQQFLEMAGGNMDQAINLFFEHGAESQAKRSRADPLAAGPAADPDEVRKPMKPKVERLVDAPQFTPGYAAYQTRLRNAEARFQEDLGGMFTMPRGLAFDGTFSEAKAHATRTARWLLVSVHDPAEFSCQALVRDVFRDETVIELIRSHFVLCQVHRNTPGAFEFEAYYTVPTLPHVAVLNPFTGEEIHLFKTLDVNTGEHFAAAVVSFLDKFSVPTTDAGALWELDDDDAADGDNGGAGDDDGADDDASADLPAARGKAPKLSRKPSVEEIAPPTHRSSSTSVARPSSTTSAPAGPAAAAAQPLRRARTQPGRPAPPPLAASARGRAVTQPEALDDDLDEDDEIVTIDSPDKRANVSPPLLAPRRECPPEPLATEKNANTIRFHFPENKKVVRRFRPTSPVEDLILFAASQGFAAPRFGLLMQFPKTNLSTLPPASSLAELKIGNTNVFIHEND